MPTPTPTPSPMNPAHMTKEQKVEYATWLAKQMFPNPNTINSPSIPTPTPTFSTPIDNPRPSNISVHSPYHIPTGSSMAQDTRTPTSVGGSSQSSTRPAGVEAKRQKALEYLQQLNNTPPPNEARIMMIGEDHAERAPPSCGRGGAVPNYSALLGPVIQSSRPEKFSGYDEDWAEFEVAWRAYAELIHFQFPLLPDKWWLTVVLKPVLDQASTLKLDNMMHLNPNLTFNEFWRELERTFGRDMAERHRREWESIKLDTYAELSLRDFRQHVSHWESALGKVHGVSGEEAARRFLKTLPASYHEMARHEEIRRAQGQFWARISKVGTLTQGDLVAWLQAFMGYPQYRVGLDRISGGMWL